MSEPANRSLVGSASVVIEPDWLGPTAFWQPRFFPLSAWVEHAPFAFWIADAVRPRVFAELGTHYGYSYFAFCEAFRRLGLETKSFALDTWQGDDHAGAYGEEVYEYVTGVNDREFGSSSTLLRGYFDDSVDQFADGTIDLLHIDGRHGYEDVLHDYESWRPKLSERAVVLFHDIAEHQEGFGVWRFWDEIKTRHPSFTFEHNHGLGVLGVGSELPETMVRFFEVAAREPERVRDAYARLGAELSAIVAGRDDDAAVRVALEERGAALEERGAELEHAEQLVAAAEAENLGLRQQLEAVRASTSWKLTAPVRKVSGVVRRRAD